MIVLSFIHWSVFQAFPCSLYPDEQPTVSSEARWFYNDMIKPDQNRKYKCMTARFVHRKVS